jgi:hypothetical protein
MTLFAALNVATGRLAGECLPRHRAKEFLVFLKKIDREMLLCLHLRLIVDTSTHKIPALTSQDHLKRDYDFGGTCEIRALAMGQQAPARSRGTYSISAIWTSAARSAAMYAASD